jgi:hypothetical protein
MQDSTLKSDGPFDQDRLRIVYLISSSLFVEMHAMFEYTNFFEYFSAHPKVQLLLFKPF